MTAAPRTLPIRVAPVPGEALDSWQEALAARLQATPADLAAAMFPARLPGESRPPRVIMAAGSDAAAIAASCQVAEAEVHALTLARYDGIALRLDRQAARVVRNVLWGRAAGSRFCPQCLAETAGRWQLSWRLGWSFACLDHDCLLADACPRCGRMQRLKPHPLTRVPHPGTCAAPAPEASGASPPRCGGDLTAARPLTLAQGHPVLAAQRFVNGIIAAGQASAGVYEASPQPAHAALADIRALAATILCASSPAGLSAVLPSDIAAEFAAAIARPHERHGSAPTIAGIFPGAQAPASAAVTAAAVTAAAGPLSSPDPGRAADGLRRLFRAEDPASWARARTASPALQAVRLSALGRAPAPAAAGPPPAAQSRARQIPALFWLSWTVRLLPRLPGTSLQQRRRCLAAAFLAVTTNTSVGEAALALGSAIDGPSAMPVLLRAKRDPRWPASAAALTRLAGWLEEHGTPIDYQRRRNLDYRSLLPDGDWIRACRSTRTVPRGQNRALTARRWLFERISGTPAELGPPDIAVSTADQHGRRADKFIVFLTTDLAAALNSYAVAWLAGHGIDEEEVRWNPPFSLLNGLDLPGSDPLALPPAEIHELLKTQRLPLHAAARSAGTTTDVIRAVLDEHPAPPRPLTPAQERVAGQITGALRARLSPDDLNDLYTRQRISLKEIGRMNGVSRTVVTRLAHEYGIHVRTPAEFRLPLPANRDWLYEQYVNRQRSIPDIAAELGTSKSRLTRHARTLDIPLRSRGNRPASQG